MVFAPDLRTPVRADRIFYFDTGADGILSTDEEDALEIHNDTNVFYKLWNGSTWNTFSTSSSSVPFTGSTRDEAGMTGAVGYSGTPREPTDHYFYELKIPLALGELNALPGDLIKPFIYLFGKGEESYWYPHTDWSDPKTYCQMTLATEPVPFDTLLVLFLLASTLTIAIHRFTLRF